MKSRPIIILLFAILIVFPGIIRSENDSLYYEHRIKNSDIPASKKLLYIDSLLALRQTGRESFLRLKAELGYEFGDYNAVIDAYNELTEHYSGNLSLSDELKFQLFYIHSLNSKRQFFECIIQSADLLNRQKPDSLLYYDALVESLLVDFNHLRSIPFMREYAERNENLYKTAIAERWPQHSIDNIKYALFTIKKKEAVSKHNYNTALSYLDSMASISLSNNRKASIATNSAYLYMLLGKYDIAEVEFKSLLESDIPDERKAVSLLNYTHMLNLQGRYSETIHLLDQYSKVGESLKSELYGSYLIGNRAVAEEGLGNHKEAYWTLMKSKNIGDSIYFNSGIQEGLLLYFDQISKGKELKNIESKYSFSKRCLIFLAIFAIVLLLCIAYMWNKIVKKEKNQVEMKAELQGLKQNYLELERSYIEISQKDNGEKAAECLNLARDEEIFSKFDSILKNEATGADEKIQLLNKAMSAPNVPVGSREKFEHHFKQAHSEFFRRLYAAYPSITPVEARMCAFLVMNLSNKEIAEMVNKSVRSVESTRYRISKKLKLAPGESIVAHLRQFLSSSEEAPER